MQYITSLNLVTNYGIISIPFLDLESLDLFTVRYKNSMELTNALIKMLKLPVTLNDINGIYIYCEYKSRKNLFKTMENNNIKYRSDNFNKDKLGETFSLYLKQKHSRIQNCGVFDINTKAMCEFRSGIDMLTDFDIENAVSKYLANAPYRTYRKVYFMIKDFVKVSINKLSLDDGKKREKKLTDISSDFEYVQTLLDKVSTGNVDVASIMDELSRVDLEDLNLSSDRRNVSLFDGLSKSDDASYYEDLYDLELYSGRSIEDLVDLSIKNLRKGRRR